MDGRRTFGFWLALAGLWFCSSCATHVRVVPRAQNCYRMGRSALEAQVNSSLASTGWQPYSTTPVKSFYRSQGGGQYTIVSFVFYPEGAGASFEMEVESGHEVNWLTFGLAGFLGRHMALGEAERWLVHWRKSRPPLDAAESALLRGD